MTIAVCGNHRVVYCTESELVWTLEQMGHKVLRFQENETTTEEMLQQCVRENARLFLYIHTHGWSSRGTITLKDLLMSLARAGVKTASFHLDRYWGLNRADKREERIGVHPFWHTDRVFTADGGNQQGFMDKKVVHSWLPPAVAKRHCFRGKVRPEYEVDVAFVGAKGYHPEYLFRGQLIAWLTDTYGPRFKRFGGDCPGGVVREENLNDLYASAKVIVGDSCFAGAPYYWSDRVPETVGRGGFLLHPTTKGLSIDGLVTYTPKDFGQLKGLIDYYLLHPESRETHTEMAMQHVIKWETYHNRMANLLDVMGLSV